MKQLIVLLGPPAAGKTTIARNLLERARLRGGTSAPLYVSSEMILRTQIAAISALELPNVAELEGEKLILSNEYRAVLTAAAVNGAISLAGILLAQPAVETILLEIPEFGYDQIAQLSRDSKGTKIAVIHLDAGLGLREERNSAREGYAKLPSEAMAFFENNRVKADFTPLSGSQVTYAKICSDQEIVETVDTVLRFVHTFTETI